MCSLPRRSLPIARPFAQRLSRMHRRLFFAMGVYRVVVVVRSVAGEFVRYALPIAGASPVILVYGLAGT
jgi:hypothetical protein